MVRSLSRSAGKRPPATRPRRSLRISPLSSARRFFSVSAATPSTAAFIEEYADYLESHIEDWTVTTTGSLVEGTSTYYMRILPEQVGQEHPAEDKESRILHIANHAPGEQC